ncbi:MAG: hypothetical protein ACPF8V_05240 [Luteibaculum sp.]
MLDFLRKELQNYSLELKLTRQEIEQSQQFYSEQEQLKAMIEKNPKVAELVRRLGLDF